MLKTLTLRYLKKELDSKAIKKYAALPLHDPVVLYEVRSYLEAQKDFIERLPVSCGSCTCFPCKITRIRRYDIDNLLTKLGEKEK